MSTMIFAIIADLTIEPGFLTLKVRGLASRKLAAPHSLRDSVLLILAPLINGRRIERTRARTNRFKIAPPDLTRPPGKLHHRAWDN
jgi:hypothetical protein